MFSPCLEGKPCPLPFPHVSLWLSDCCVFGASLLHDPQELLSLSLCIFSVCFKTPVDTTNFKFVFPLSPAAWWISCWACFFFILEPLINEELLFSFWVELLGFFVPIIVTFSLWGNTADHCNQCAAPGKKQNKTRLYLQANQILSSSANTGVQSLD